MNYKKRFIEYLGDPHNEEKLNEYIQFVIENVSTEQTTQNHHILPRSIFGENDYVYSLKYNDHIEAHKLLAEAYPIREFTRPLNFMLPKNDRELLEHRKLIALSAKESWKKFKKTPGYQEWRKNKSELMTKRNNDGLASKAVKVRYEKNPNAKEEISKFFSALWKDPEYREKTIKSMKDSASSPERRSIRKKATEKRWNNMSEQEREEFRAKMNDINKNEEKRKYASEKIKEKWKDPEFKKKMENRKHGSNSATMKEKWKDPEFKKKMLDARKKK